MNTDLKYRIEALVYLGHYLINLESQELNNLYEISFAENKWFTKDNIVEALGGVRDEFLNEIKLNDWVSKYEIKETDYPKKVGLVLAGNIPAVGFNDVLCVFVSGNISLIKYSDKDKRIIPHLLEKVIEKYPQFKNYFVDVEMLKDFDAVIATGSDNSARYFNAYFGKYPNIIRKNRNSIAVLNGTETKEEILSLGKDIFSYFGLGCRNVSKIFIPTDYDIDFLLEHLQDYKEIVQHNKYMNNFDYTNALFLLNKVSFKNNGSIILKEDLSYASRIASLHYEYYDNLVDLKIKLKNDEEKIQCIVSNIKFENLYTYPLGQAQCPTLSDYADGIDTMKFLTSL